MKISLAIIIIILFVIGFKCHILAEDTNLRITLNVNAHGRSVIVTLNSIELKKVTGGHAQAIQLYHQNHPLLKEAPKDYKEKFCLKEGKNTIEITHHLKKGETSGVFKLHTQQPKGFTTIILK